MTTDQRGYERLFGEAIAAKIDDRQAGREYRCVSCGFLAVGRTTPSRCPTCGEVAWQVLSVPVAAARRR